MKEVIGNLDFMMSKKNPLDVGPISKKNVLIQTMSQKREMIDVLNIILTFLLLIIVIMDNIQ